MGLFLLIALIGLGVYIFVRHRILSGFTDPVTRANRGQLGRLLGMLIGGFFLFLLLMSTCARS